MSLTDLELRGVKLPPPETFYGDLTAHQIVEKINQFHQRLNRENNLEVAPFAEAYFLNLIALYPVSMCSKTMSDELKLVAALFYFGSKPTKEPETGSEEAKELFPRNKPNSPHHGYSYEDLALIFDRSRLAIVEAVRQKQEQAKVMLEEAELRRQSKKAALEELTDEEKHTLALQQNSNLPHFRNQCTKRTTKASLAKPHEPIFVASCCYNKFL
jgi:hypothetical protein